MCEGYQNIALNSGDTVVFVFPVYVRCDRHGGPAEHLQREGMGDGGAHVGKISQDTQYTTVSSMHPQLVVLQVMVDCVVQDTT